MSNDDITRSDTPSKLEHERSDPEIRLSSPEVDADEHILTGEDMGHYLLVGELATGGMAEVFLAVQKGLEGVLKVVVVKRVLPHLTASPNFRQMFADEARVAARLEHPNIVRTYDFGASEGNYFTVMEYLAGEDISSLMRRLRASKTHIPTAATLSLIIEICKGLHFAHEFTDMAGRPMGLVHRDVNPSNLIVTYAGEVKVIDFGVAKTSTNVATTRAGTIKGKMAYMSPEQIAARPIDRRVDVFSTGVVLWQLLTLRTLFGRDNEAATMNAIMNDPIPPPSRYRSEVSPELDEIVMRALARAPADRFSTMEELQQALEDFVAKEPPLERKWLSTLLETQFGTTRAEAKRGIAQTRSLRRNIAVVMRFRTDVSSRPSGRLDTSPIIAAAAVAEASGVRTTAIGSNADRTPPSSVAALVPAPVPAPAPARSRARVIAVSTVAALVLGVLTFIVLRKGEQTPAASSSREITSKLEIVTKPAGAAVFVDGEPTGMTTPAVVDALLEGKHIIRVELAGHLPIEDSINVVPGRNTQRTLELVATVGVSAKAAAPDENSAAGQLVVRGLATGAVFFINDEEYAAGDVVTLPPKTYRVRVVFAGATLVDQEVEIGSGHQVWTVRDKSFVREN